MAPKRSAPPPPPHVASSEETDSGSGSKETEDEEEIAHSPLPVAPRNTARPPPPQKSQESEGSDEEEDEEEEEEEEGEEDDDEEEDEKANQVAPFSATTNPSSPPPNHEESETSDEEEDEEADEEVAPPKPAPNQEAEGKSAKPSSSIEGNNPSARFQRTWSRDDEVRILEALDAHRVEHGTLPQADTLMAALAGKLDNSGYSASDLQKRVNSVRSRYTKALKKGELPSKDRRLFDLCKSVWGSVTKSVAIAGPRRDVSEMCELYPYLAEEVKALETVHRGLFKREFEMISDEKARALDTKIKKSRLAQMRQHQRRHDLIKEVTKTLMDLID